jgi:hypothetical protein
VTRARDHERDERERTPSRTLPEPAPESWRSAAGNVAVQAAMRSGVLPSRATAGLDRLLARAPAARIDRQEVEEEEEVEEAVAAPAGEVEGAQAPQAEVPAGPAAEEEELELPE